MDPQHHPARRANPPSGVRALAALAALGIFLSLAGVVFLLPFVLSANAIQNDVYMTNLFLSPLLITAGVALTLISRWRYVRASAARWPWVGMTLIALVGAGIVAAASFLVGGHYASFPPGEISWPPYLNGWLLAVTAAVGAGVAVAAWLWAAREPGGAHAGAA